MAEQKLSNRNWLACILPWPGKKKWADTIITKVALLGGVIEYTAVSAFDWDEAWTIELDHETIIASSNKIATALMFLEQKGIS